MAQTSSANAHRVIVSSRVSAHSDLQRDQQLEAAAGVTDRTFLGVGASVALLEEKRNDVGCAEAPAVLLDRVDGVRVARVFVGEAD